MTKMDANRIAKDHGIVVLRDFIDNARPFTPEDAAAENSRDNPPPPPADPVDLWAMFDPPTLPRGLLPEMLERYAIDQGRR